MPVSSLRGSLTSTSTPEGVRNEWVEGNEPLATTVIDRIKADQVVKDTFSHATVLNTELSSEVFQKLKAYISGATIKVTYYRKHTPDMNNLSGDAGNEDTNTIHDSFDRINTMELRVPGSIAFAYLNEANMGQVSGNIITYPGFVPHIGDFFLYGVSDGKTGKFNLTTVNRLAISANTCYTADIELSAFVDTGEIAEIETDVVDVLFFDLQTFVNGRGVLLHTDERVLFNDAENLIQTLQAHYVQNFFDRMSYISFVRTDGVYDPYVVEFVNRLFPHEILGTKALQLLRTIPDYDKSYWYFLEHPNDAYRTRAYSSYLIETFVCGPRDTHITALINRDYVQLVTTDTTDAIPYISEGIGDIADDQTDFDAMVRLYLEQKMLDPTMLLTLSETYSDMTAEEQFYKIPVLLYLLHCLKYNITQGILRNVTTSASEYIPTRYEFTQTNLSAEKVLVTRLFTGAGNALSVLGVIDNGGVQHLFASGEIIYSSEATHVHMAGLMTRLSITELTGTWALVITGAV
jgi:hypothetical protein